MGEISPSTAKLRELVATSKDIAPLVMINLFQFRAEAVYDPSSVHAPCSGREAYARYGDAVRPLLEACGGRSLWSGAVLTSLIAPESEKWDYATLIHYPSIGALIDMSSTDEYQVASEHRTAALHDSRLIVTNPDRTI